MKALIKMSIILLVTTFFSCSSEDDSVSVEVVSPPEVNTAPTAVNLSLEEQECNMIGLSWSASSDINENNSITYKVYVNDVLVASDLTGLTYTAEVSLSNYPAVINVTAIDNLQAESELSNTLEIEFPVSDNINFTDANLKQALLDNPEPIDINLDGEISECEASLFTETLSLSQKEISSLSDIVYFTNARDLNAVGNNITDVSVLTDSSFERIFLSFNQLESFDMEGNSNVKVLSIEHNELISIDLSQFVNLESARLSNNNLSSIDLSNNPLLSILNLTRNSISQVDVSQNQELTELYLSFNNLTIIDVSSNVNLEKLDVSENLLTSLFIEQNTNLKGVYCSDTFIEQLDLSNQPNLEEFVALRSSQLAQLDLRNGNNSMLELMIVNESPNLSCIEVDDVDNIPSDWQKDDSASYSLDCN
ncbi:hypothetical protein [uncultured Dokdonia sp.]|uniref:hypothetical protein n=1 Tax=Dokdonia sp. R78006 TaxID=3093866 RepID=UPI002635A814|nr:hypothetical protein [uncultured Dokdonia sp.]